MEWLSREQAPLSERVWNAVDDAVRGAATHVMAARRVADFEGPSGWDTVAIRRGTTRSLEASRGAARLAVPEVILLREIRADFDVKWEDIDVYLRGGPVLDVHGAEEAARAVALAEDALAFEGEGDMPGFLTAHRSPHHALGDWSVPGQADTDILAAVERVDRAGVPGPYDLVLDSSRFYVLQHATSQGGGYPAARQVKGTVRHVYRSDVIRGGALFSTRGRDFILSVGGDLAVGYGWHDREAVHLFVAESMAVQVVTPEAVCVLDAAAEQAPAR